MANWETLNGSPSQGGVHFIDVENHRSAAYVGAYLLEPKGCQHLLAGYLLSGRVPSKVSFIVDRETCFQHLFLWVTVILDRVWYSTVQNCTVDMKTSPCTAVLFAQVIARTTTHFNCFCYVLYWNAPSTNEPSSWNSADFDECKNIREMKHRNKLI